MIESGVEQGTQVSDFASLRPGDVVREVSCPACGCEHVVVLTKLGQFTDDPPRSPRARWRKGWEYSPDCRPGEKGHRAITERLVTAGWIYLIARGRGT